jgi:antitoxin (DNA-binding transcriptional repressor) of toxin-antitoxin stability system
MAMSIAISWRRRSNGGYSVADAKNRLPKLIDKTLGGDEVVITLRGKPVVELRPPSREPAPSI